MLSPSGDAAATLPDLSTPEEIDRLVRTFYDRVAVDDLLAPVFVDQAKVDWEEHLPRLIGFWCQLELGISRYTFQPTQKHTELSNAISFRAEQFQRWVDLFHGTIDTGWSGPHAESIKDRAIVIAKAQSMVVPSAEDWVGTAEPRL
ncbi:MAG: hemoglobin [Planctomycetota bacterium]|jgi:hemoglobin